MASGRRTTTSEAPPAGSDRSSSAEIQPFPRVLMVLLLVPVISHC